VNNVQGVPEALRLSSEQNEPGIQVEFGVPQSPRVTTRVSKAGRNFGQKPDRLLPHSHRLLGVDKGRQESGGSRQSNPITPSVYDECVSAKTRRRVPRQTPPPPCYLSFHGA
jgi:hypothetical protein